ncbi:MAG: YdcF family protein [Prolixibacteraceae bacterium]|nr:YdcF family protein [Prolixibacteraceae bacterium]
MIIKFKNIHFFRILRIFFLITGVFFISCIILAFTTLPYWGLHWLGTSKSYLKEKPETIILMGGGGMPSESNLMRSWYTALAAENYNKALVLIAMPGDIKDTLSTPKLMKEELVLRGINPTRIVFENQGKNTRSQALQCKNMINTDEPVLLVTSPEHTLRSVLSFQKAGFLKVNALPAFENVTEANLKFKDDELGGNKNMIPDVGNIISVRYQLWNHLKYEIIFTRELTALLYYKIRGWI